jgi:protein TonB
MRSQEKDSIDDMVFENRNKEYGSYALRKKFYARLAIGFGVSLFLFLGISLVYFWYLSKAGDEKVYMYSSSSPYLKSIQGSLMTKEEIESYTGRTEKPPVEQPVQKPSVSQQSFVVTEKVTSEEKLPPEVEEDNENSSEEMGGLLVDDTTAFGGMIGNGLGMGAGTGVFDRIPEFPGGDATKYVEQNLRYPALAIKQKIHGIVIVSFVINKTGHVTNVKVEKSVNPIIDQEAIKTIQSMPVWKPGMMNGKPINFMFRMPINFMPLS